MIPGAYVFPRHVPQQIVDWVRAFQPSAVKAFLHLTSGEWWQTVRDASPGSILIGVPGEQSDNSDINSPELDAEASARVVDADNRYPRLLICKNELLLNSSPDSYWAAWADYMVRWIRRCHALGLACIVGEINTGHPYVSVIDGTDQWPTLAPVDAEMKATDYWGLHEYWGASGPLGIWPFTSGRHMRQPFTHNIIIDECGFDRAVDSGPPNHGWGGILTQAQYVQQIVEYHRMLTDPRVKGTCLFLADFDNSMWAGFDIMPLLPDLLARRAEMLQPLPQAIMPASLSKPLTTYLYISQTFARHPAPAKGLDFSCYSGTPVLAAADGVIDKVIDLGAVSYGRYIQINHLWGFTRYAHLDSFAVAKGDRVTAGQRIGNSGTSGLSTGPHLHFEVLPLSMTAYPYRVDPAPLLALAPPVPVPPVDNLSRMRNHLWANLYPAGGVPCVPDSAFYKAAKTWALGAPVTREVDFEGNRMQGYMAGWVWAVLGQWANVHRESWL